MLKVSSILLSWIIISIFLLFGVLYIFTRISDTKEIDYLLLSSSKNIFKSPEGLVLASQEVLTAVRAEDARPVLVERFLHENSSPMSGMGKTFVTAADKYELDWRLLPAIAFQESTLGKHIIFGSYNAFGWGVIDNTTIGMSFNSWEDSIFTVAKGLREDYLNKGYTTPETININYAADKDWNKKVRFAMEEIAN